MKRASRLMSMVLLTMTVSCSSSVVPVTSPPATIDPIQIYHTQDTSLLVDLLLASEINFDFDVQPRLGTYSRLREGIQPDLIPYFLTHHRPMEIASDLQAIPLAQDGIAILKHPDNPISDLSLDNLQRVYQGFITNWAELGGAESEIQLYSREDGSAIRLAFNRLVMGQQRISPNARILTSSEQVLEAITNDISGIAYVPISALGETSSAFTIASIEASQTTISDNRYPLRTTIYAVGSADLSIEYQQLFLWFQTATADELNPFVALPR